MPKSKPPTIPTNWPHQLPYLSHPIIAPNLSKDILTQALTSPALEKDCATIANPATPYTNIRITPITDPSHPAHEQCGLFTTRVHEPDSFICLYLGLVHGTPPTSPNTPQTQSQTQNPPESPHATSNYDLSLDRSLSLAIDGAEMGNEARFINDYRGSADRPNAEFRDVVVRGVRGGKSFRERGVGVFVKKAKKRKWAKGKVEKVEAGGIGKGEEVLVSYGRGFWSVRRVEGE